MAWLPWLGIGPFPEEWLDVPLAGFGCGGLYSCNPSASFTGAATTCCIFCEPISLLICDFMSKETKIRLCKEPRNTQRALDPAQEPGRAQREQQQQRCPQYHLQLCPAMRSCRTSRELFPPQNLPWMSPQPSAVPKGRGEAAAALVCTGSLLKSLKPLTPNSWKQRKKTFPSLDVLSSSSWTGFLFTTNQLNLLISEKKNHFDHKAWMEAYKEQNTLRIPLQVKQMNAAVQRDRAQEAVCPLSRAREPFPWLNRNRSPSGKGRLMALNYQLFVTDTLATSEPEKHLCTCQGGREKSQQLSHSLQVRKTPPVCR